MWSGSSTFEEEELANVKMVAVSLDSAGLLPGSSSGFTFGFRDKGISSSGGGIYTL